MTASLRNVKVNYAEAKGIVAAKVTTVRRLPDGAFGFYAAVSHNQIKEFSRRNKSEAVVVKSRLVRDMEKAVIYDLSNDKVIGFDVSFVNCTIPLPA